MDEKEEKLLKEMFLRENLKRALKEYDEAPESTQREVDAAIAESFTRQDEVLKEAKAAYEEALKRTLKEYDEARHAVNEELDWLYSDPVRKWAQALAENGHEPSQRLDMSIKMWELLVSLNAPSVVEVSIDLAAKIKAYRQDYYDKGVSA